MGPTFPDYERSIVNLMASITRGFNGEHPYAGLPELQDLQRYQKIALLVVDALGFNALEQRQNSFLNSHKQERPLTSTLLATTACANTVFATGLPAQQTGLPSVFVDLPDVGLADVLKYVTYEDGMSLAEQGIDPAKIIDQPSWHVGLQADCNVLMEERLANSPLSGQLYHGGNVNLIKTANNDPVKLLEQFAGFTSQQFQNRTFIHGYLPQLDSISHKTGYKSPEANAVFDLIDKQVEQIAAKLPKDTKLIVTADHGVCEDTDQQHVIHPEAIPGLLDCIASESGESRARFFKCKPGMEDLFQRLVGEQIPQAWIFPSGRLLADGRFGLGSPNPRLVERLGDYVVFMKENYNLGHYRANPTLEAKGFSIGRHGGVSANEMYVPLVVLD